MSLKRDASGRLHIESPLMGESLMDKSLLATPSTPPEKVRGAYGRIVDG